MFGRSVYGRPWWLGAVANELEPGQGKPAPTLIEERNLLLWLQDETLRLYGDHLGNRTFRKHLGWTIERLQERALLTIQYVSELRAKLLPSNDNAHVTQGITIFFDIAMEAA
jgi:tRNA-dihydrouridine synthase B